MSREDGRVASGAIQGGMGQVEWLEEAGWPRGELQNAGGGAAVRGRWRLGPPNCVDA
jgi:hypothetical protein